MSDPRPDHAAPAALTLRADVGHAFGFVFGAVPADTVGAWAVYLPVVGLTLGALWLAADYLGGAVGGRIGASIAVLAAHAALTRARSLSALGALLLALPRARPDRLARMSTTTDAAARLAAIAVAAIELVLLCELERFRPVGLLFAPLLGSCGMVVLAVGSRAARADGRRMKFAPEVQFREFGLASTATFALIFVSTEFLGLLLILATAAFTIAARVFFHRWSDGITTTVLRASAEATQLIVLAVLAAF